MDLSFLVSKQRDQTWLSRKESWEHASQADNDFRRRMKILFPLQIFTSPDFRFASLENCLIINQTCHSRPQQKHKSIQHCLKSLMNCNRNEIIETLSGAHLVSSNSAKCGVSMWVCCQSLETILIYVLLLIKQLTSFAIDNEKKMIPRNFLFPISSLIKF